MKTRFVCFLIMALVLFSCCVKKSPLREELWEVTGVYYYEAAGHLAIVFKDSMENLLNYYVDEIKTSRLYFSALIYISGVTLSQEVGTGGYSFEFWTVVPSITPGAVVATFDTSKWFYEAESTMFSDDIVAKCRIITDSMAVTFLP